MDFLFYAVFSVLISTIHGAELINLPKRSKRQISLWCSDNTQAVSRSRNGTCLLGYRYDPRTQYCCVGVAMPVCPNGVAATSLCVDNRYCGAALTCTSLLTSTGTTTNVCCNSGTIIATTVSSNACASPNIILGPCLTGNVCPPSYRCINVNSGFSCCGPPQRFPIGK